MVHNVNKKPKLYLEIDAFDSSLKALNEIKPNISGKQWVGLNMYVLHKIVFNKQDSYIKMIKHGTH